MCKADRGNILFLILLAIILFAALTYAVNSSMRGGEGKSGGSETAQAQVSDMSNFFASMDAGIQRMMLVGGVKDYELNFYYQAGNKYILGGYDNTNCTESRCRVFDPAGGGVPGRILNDFYRSAPGPTTARLFYISLPGVGTSLPDIVYILYGVKTEICRDVNKRIGVDDMLYSVLHGEGSTLMYWSAIPVGPIPDTTLTATGLPTHIGSSQATFCACSSATLTSCETGQNPKIYHVLLAR